MPTTLLEHTSRRSIVLHSTDSDDPSMTRQ